MVALFLFSVQAEGDTLRGSKEEVVKYVLSQGILGCGVYPILVGGCALFATGDMASSLLYSSLSSAGYLLISASYVKNHGVNKPVSVASFTGALDGLVWGYLVYETIEFWSYQPAYQLLGDVVYPYNAKMLTFMAFGATAGNLLGFHLANGGSSEGAYVLKTFAVFHTPYAYMQAKRLILGDYFFEGSDIYNKADRGLRTDFTVSTALSLVGGALAYNLTKDKYEITGGDALFMGSNAIKGVLILETPIHLTYALSTGSYKGFPTYYQNPTYDRLAGLSNLLGMWLGYWFSYKLVKRVDLNVFEGLIYAIIPPYTTG
ncbi:MAG: hypothetical protein ABIL53_07710 [candidate division WOR-3 bacterium]